MKIKVVERKMLREVAIGKAHSDDNLIEIDPRLKGKKYLEILIHEALHLLYPKASEAEVIKKSITMTNLLWEQGYRKIDNTNSDPLQDGKKH